MVTKTIRATERGLIGMGFPVTLIVLRRRTYADGKAAQDQKGKRSKNFPEVIQRIKKSEADIAAIATRATTIIFASFATGVTLLYPGTLWAWTPSEKRFDTRLKLSLRLL